MEALGTLLGEQGRSEASVWHRISKGNALYVAKNSLLCDPKIPVKNRIGAFDASCVSSVLHGAGERAYTLSMM